MKPDSEHDEISSSLCRFHSVHTIWFARSWRVRGTDFAYEHEFKWWNNRSSVYSSIPSEIKYVKPYIMP